MALRAVIFHYGIQCGTFFEVTASGFEYRSKTGEGCVQAYLVCVGGVLMAGDATALSRRVAYQVYMSEGFLLLLVITTMAERTTEFSVSAFRKFSILQEDLFPYLQRR